MNIKKEFYLTGYRYNYNHFKPLISISFHIYIASKISKSGF